MTDYITLCEFFAAGFRGLRADIMVLREDLATTKREVVRLKQWNEVHLRRGHWTAADLQEVTGEER